MFVEGRRAVSRGINIGQTTVQCNITGASLAIISLFADACRHACNRTRFAGQHQALCVTQAQLIIPPPMTVTTKSSPAAASHAHRIIIEGVTLQGRAFRPSDWAERLCGVMSTFGHDQQMRYSRYVRPVLLDGVRCVVVEPALSDIEPRAYRFLLDFASDNELVVIDPTVAATEDYCPVPGNALEKLA
jgi:hypothetical protein